jgi:ribosomal protein S18 acetylase RimI-like enzyme
MTQILKGIKPEERKSVEEILRSTGFFYENEIQTALELVDETCAKGSEKSGYSWMKIVDDNKLVAFATYGKNPCSSHSYDIYWIVVQQNLRSKKLGSKLIKAIEEHIKESGGKIIWIETSGRPLYASTEGFYIKNNYIFQASLKDFYGPDDPKQIYSKVL